MHSPTAAPPTKQHANKADPIMTAPAHPDDTTQLLQNLLLANALLSYQLHLRGVSLDEPHPALALSLSLPLSAPLLPFTPLPFAPAQTTAPSPFFHAHPLAHPPVITLPPLQQPLPHWDSAIDIPASTLNPSALLLPAFPLSDDTALSSTLTQSPSLPHETRGPTSAAPVRKRHSRRQKDFTRNKNRSYNAFFVYMLQKRDAARRKDPFLGYRELTKRLAQEWAALSSSEKAVYKLKARQMADAKTPTLP